MPINTQEYQIRFNSELYTNHYIEINKLFQDGKQYFKRFNCQIKASKQPGVFQIINHGNQDDAKTMINDILNDYFTCLYQDIKYTSQSQMIVHNNPTLSNLQPRPKPTILLNSKGYLYSFGQKLYNQTSQYHLTNLQNTISIHQGNKLLIKVYLPFTSQLPKNLLTDHQDILKKLQKALNDTANLFSSSTYTSILDYQKYTYTIIPQLCFNAFRQLDASLDDPKTNYQKAGNTISLIIMLLLNTGDKNSKHVLTNIQKLSQIK